MSAITMPRPQPPAMPSDPGTSVSVEELLLIIGKQHVRIHKMQSQIEALVAKIEEL